jgi:hypothetical protein
LVSEFEQGIVVQGIRELLLWMLDQKVH